MKALTPFVLLAALLPGCITPPAAPDPVVVKPKIALVLGGGAVRGFAHIGVIKLLDIMDIRPDIIVGTSAGSVAGVLYAAGFDGFRLQELAWELDKSMISDWSVFGKGLIRGKALEDYINAAVGHRSMERLPRRFACVATRLSDGQAMLFQTGNPGRAVRASSSVPGVFEPVPIDGQEYVDGGLVSPVPIRFARELGADFVIAVDVASTPLRESHDTKIDIMLKTYTIMGQSIRAASVRRAGKQHRLERPCVVRGHRSRVSDRRHRRPGAPEDSPLQLDASRAICLSGRIHAGQLRGHGAGAIALLGQDVR